jgi:hypothetical protein
VLTREPAGRQGAKGVHLSAFVGGPPKSRLAAGKWDNLEDLTTLARCDVEVVAVGATTWTLKARAIIKLCARLWGREPGIRPGSVPGSRPALSRGQLELAVRRRTSPDVSGIPSPVLGEAENADT